LFTLEIVEENQNLVEEISNSGTIIEDLEVQNQTLQESIEKINQDHTDELAKPHPLVYHLQNEIKILNHQLQRSQIKIDEQCRIITELTYKLEKASRTHPYYGMCFTLIA
jgi:DUF438 domain-containing protein